MCYSTLSLLQCYLTFIFTPYSNSFSFLQLHSLSFLCCIPVLAPFPPQTSCLNFSSVLPSNVSICYPYASIPFLSNVFLFLTLVGCYVLNSTTTLSSSNLLCQNIPVILLLYPPLLSSSGSLWLQRQPSRKVQN